MFKMFEKKVPKTYRLDMADANVASIVPGSILVQDTDGVRLAIAGDTMLQEDAGSYYISNDYYSNTSIGSIYGHAGSIPGHIAAAPITEIVEIEFAYSGAVSKGDVFAIIDGALTKVTSTTPAPVLLIGVATEDKTLAGIVKMSTVTERHETAPTLHVVSDTGMVEGGQTAEITLGIYGEFEQSEIEDETNWDINTDTAFNDEPTFTVEAGLTPDEVTITFDAGQGKTISFTNEPIVFTIAKEAVASGRDDVVGYYYPNEETGTIGLSVTDDVLMLEGFNEGTLEVTLAGATFDPVNAIVPANWAFTGLANIASDGVDSIVLSGGDTIATITFGSATVLETGAITISAKHEAIIGMNEGATTPIDYTLPQITILIASGYNIDYHDVGDVLKIENSNDTYSEEYEVTEKLAGDDDILALKYIGAAGNVSDTTEMLYFARFMPLEAVAGTMSTETLERRLTLVSQVGVTDDMYAKFSWLDGETEKDSFYNIASVEAGYLVVTLVNGFDEAPDGAYTGIDIFFSVDALYGRPLAAQA